MNKLLEVIADYFLWIFEMIKADAGFFNESWYVVVPCFLFWGTYIIIKYSILIAPFSLLMGGVTSLPINLFGFLIKQIKNR